MFKHEWIMLPMLTALVILPRLSIDLYLASLPDIGEILHASDDALQMTLTIFMFGYALSMLITGPLSDRLGRKHVLIYGLTLYLVATFSCALANSISLFTVSRFFQALGGCCGTVIARVMVKDFYSQEKQIKILAHLSAAMAVCPLLIPILGGTLQTYFGWRSNFFVLGLFALALLLVSKRQINEYALVREAFSFNTLINHYKTLFKNRLFIGYSLAISFAWCDYFSFTLESPFLLQKILGYNSISFGILFAVIIIGYLIGTQLTKYFANRIGWDELIFIATLCCLGGALLITALVVCNPLNYGIIAMPMTIIMVGVGMIIPCSQAAVMQPFTKIAGTASGLFFFIQMSFGGLCGLILQSFKHDSALPMAITILISSILLTLSFYKLIWSMKRKEKFIPMLIENVD